MNAKNTLTASPKVHGYGSGYTGPKPVHEQIEIIHELFPEIKWKLLRSNKNDITVPEGAEGLFAIPRWRQFARTYRDATMRVLNKLLEVRGRLYLYTGGRFPEQLGQYGPSVAEWREVAFLQRKYDVFVIPAQFGAKLVGRSTVDTRTDLEPGEFCLGTFAITIMLLTHPERLSHYDNLRIICAGDEFKGSPTSQQFTPFFYWNDVMIKVNEHWSRDKNQAVLAHLGIPTGFVPS